jgi:hypothetical protein
MAEESVETGWIWQISPKIGSTLINRRCYTTIDFEAALEEMKRLAPAIREAVAALEPAPTPGASFPVTAPQYPVADVRATPPASPAPAPAPAQGQEVGPLTVEKVEAIDGIGKDKLDPVTGAVVKKGRPYTRHVAHFSGGLKASTFDVLVATAARGLIGKLAFIHVTPSSFGGYDLHSVRSA